MSAVHEFDSRSASSSDSSLAPTDFHLSQSFDSTTHTGAVSIALERCRLCGGSRRSFYCKHCVRSGDFVHSRTSHQPFQQMLQNSDGESCADKMKCLKMLKKERDKILERFHVAVAKKSRVSRWESDIRLRQQRIRMMKTALTEMSDAIATGRCQLDELLTRSANAEKKKQMYEKEHVKILALLSKMSDNIAQQTVENQCVLNEVTVLRQRSINDLVMYIFPISELPAKSENLGNSAAAAAVEDLQQSTVSLLADARRTAYVKGRWVYTESGYEQLYRIVAPTLPGNGDYSRAMFDIKEPTTLTGDVSLQVVDNPSQTITAALSLTAQLVKLLSFYLDVILPWRLDFSEFCSSELTEHRLNRAVLRLNHNILRLCFTQSGVNIEGIEPRNTIINLLSVINSPQLGNPEGCHIIDDEETAMLMRSIESSLLGVSASEDDNLSHTSDSDSDVSNVDEFNELAVGIAGPEERSSGWEHVPITLPEVDTSITMRTASPSYFAESHSTVTSIVSSLWRWGRGSDK